MWLQISRIGISGAGPVLERARKGGAELGKGSFQILVLLCAWASHSPSEPQFPHLTITTMLGCLEELSGLPGRAACFGVQCTVSSLPALFPSQGGESLTSSPVSSRGRAKHSQGPTRLRVVFFTLSCLAASSLAERLAPQRGTQRPSHTQAKRGSFPWPFYCTRQSPPALTHAKV